MSLRHEERGQMVKIGKIKCVGYVSMFQSYKYATEVEIIVKLEMFIMEAYFHDRILLRSREVVEFWRCVNLAALFLC